MATQCQKHLAMNFQGPSLSPQIDVYIQFLNRPYNKFYTPRKGPAPTCPIVLNTSGLWELLYTGSIWPFLKKTTTTTTKSIQQMSRCLTQYPTYVNATHYAEAISTIFA